MDENIKKNILMSGTSLVGIVCKDGIVMAGDRKATAGNIIMNKNSQKVVAINEYLAVSGTGSVADIRLSRKLLRAQLKLKELKDKAKPSVKEAANIMGMMAYKNIRQPSMVPFIAGTMVGGVNSDGTTELYSVEPAGSVMKVDDFDANFSSGMPYILGLLERQYKKDLSVEEGIELAEEAIKSASERDTGSGLGIDIFKITKKGIEHISKQVAIAVYKTRD
jgi:proteasome beta subunit